MGLFTCLSKCYSPVTWVIFSEYHGKFLRGSLAFARGFGLGQIYYYYMLKDIPFPYNLGHTISLILSIVFGLMNVAWIQIRCISLLTFPMYCGKAGRGVLKAVVLTYVVAGPITNMGLNAKEVVRVFACSTELAFNLSRAGSGMVAQPLRRVARGLKEEVDAAARELRYFEEVAAPIVSEIEFVRELNHSRELTAKTDALLGVDRLRTIENKYAPSHRDRDASIYVKKYMLKSEYRCNNLLSRTVLRCREQMSASLETCLHTAPRFVAPSICAPLGQRAACDLLRLLRPEICDSRKQIDSGLADGYVYLKQTKRELMKGWKDVILLNKPEDHEIYDVQDAKQTGERVKQTFEEKFSIMQSAVTVVNACVALLFLRIVVAARFYHDTYLTSIEFDNVYVTDYFKTIDARRRERNQDTLLPLKKVQIDYFHRKMERSRYVDVHSLGYKSADRHRLVTQALKVLLEVVTATTFVMLDRLFYEALDVVRQHALRNEGRGVEDLEIKVEGTGLVANSLRAMLSYLDSPSRRAHHATSDVCLPRPSLMPAIFFVRIYGGYLWVLLLLCANPYTLRLRRLICSHFYPRREKQRTLHLYNDILKKRIKLDETLRRKAVQAVRAHYLSGESLLSARMRFPHILGWLRVLPAARMTCLICSEIEPRNDTRREWHSCTTARCPFVYCGECWREAGARCLACDPSLAELSDVDSLSEDELPKY